MASENDNKKRHGESLQESIIDILTDFKENGYIKSFTKNYYIGRPGYEDTKQFYIAFLVEIDDNHKWALYSTTSMRDRFKCQLWDALNVKAIDPTISKAYLVYPDGSEDAAPFLSKKKEINEKKGYYTIDDILTQSEFVECLDDQVLEDKSDASKRGILGNKFERRVARLLSYANNIEKWKSDDRTIEGLHYDLFVKIANCFSLSKENTKKISATSRKKDIGSLPSGGNVKTDVIVNVELMDGTQLDYTISCKRSGADEVTVHDYTAKQFSKVLDTQNEELCLLLEQFQEVGGIKKFGTEKCERFTKILAPYVNKLSKWVVGGHGGEGDPNKQWANYILIHDSESNESSIYSIDEYLRLLSQDEHTGQFGTPFKWTYPSGQLGKRIQLKGKIRYIRE